MEGFRRPQGKEAVAWCSIAPKETYGNLTGKTETATASVWSVVCFYLQREHRNQGIVQQLITEAILYAKTHDAKKLEAYPVDADSPSYRFMGNVSTFHAMGFREAGRAGHEAPHHGERYLRFFPHSRCRAEACAGLNCVQARRMVPRDRCGMNPLSSTNAR